MSNNILNQEFLTPGSVWHRENGKESRVICVTNLTLPEKLQAKNPPQVVYLSENGDFLSTSIDNFLAKREFYNVDGDLESSVLELPNKMSAEDLDAAVDTLLGETNSGDDLLVIADDDAGEQFDEKSSADSEDTFIQSAMASLSNLEGFTTGLIQYEAVSAVLPELISAETLQDLTINYDQSPNFAAPGTIVHSLTILQNETFSRDDLFNCFNQDRETAGLNTLFLFRVQGELVDWDTLINVSTTIVNGMAAYKVALMSTQYEAEATTTELPAGVSIVQAPLTTPVATIVPQTDVTVSTGSGLAVNMTPVSLVNQTN